MPPARDAAQRQHRRREQATGPRRLEIQPDIVAVAGRVDASMVGRSLGVDGVAGRQDMPREDRTVPDGCFHLAEQVVISWIEPLSPRIDHVHDRIGTPGAHRDQPPSVPVRERTQRQVARIDRARLERGGGGACRAPGRQIDDAAHASAVDGREPAAQQLDAVERVRVDDAGEADKTPEVERVVVNEPAASVHRVWRANARRFRTSKRPSE